MPARSFKTQYSTSGKPAAKGKLTRKKNFAREMRANPTRPEKNLWDALSGVRHLCRFERQKVLFGYIADVYCPRLGLVIEADGPVHANAAQARHDQYRDGVLRSKGFTVLRFGYAQLAHNPGSVERIVRQTIDRLTGMERKGFLRRLFG